MKLKHMFAALLLIAGTASADVKNKDLQDLLDVAGTTGSDIVAGYISGFRDGHNTVAMMMAAGAGSDFSSVLESTYAVCNERNVFHTDVIIAKFKADDTKNETDLWAFWFNRYIMSECYQYAVAFASLFDTPAIER